MNFLHQAVALVMRFISVVFTLAAAGFLILIPIILVVRERSRRKMQR